jgi:hypothetical protein
MELEMHPFSQTDARSGQSDCDHHFLHTNVFLRHASGASGEAEEHIERILTRAAVAKRRVWVSSLLFAELRPSMFVRGRFVTLHELARYIRSLATLVTPDPNTMLRVARLRDAKWQRPADVRGRDEKPRMMSFCDAVQIASALWVKEAGGVRGGCAGKFGCHGGGAADAHPACSPGDLDSANGAGRTRIPRRFLRERRGTRRKPIAGKRPPDDTIRGKRRGPKL